MGKQNISARSSNFALWASWLHLVMSFTIFLLTHKEAEARTGSISWVWQSGDQAQFPHTQNSNLNLIHSDKVPCCDQDLAFQSDRTQLALEPWGVLLFLVVVDGGPQYTGLGLSKQGQGFSLCVRWALKGSPFSLSALWSFYLLTQSPWYPPVKSAKNLEPRDLASWGFD